MKTVRLAILPTLFGASSLVAQSGPFAPSPTFASAPATAATYARYSPWACVATGYRIHRTFWREGGDTARYTVQGDTLVTDAQRATRSCIEAVVPSGNINAVAMRDLIALAETYLMLGDTASARLAIARRLQHEQRGPVSMRAETFEEIVQAYVTARAAEPGAAAQYLTQLDALGPDAGEWRVRAHAIMAAFYGLRVVDDVAADREANAAIAASVKLSPHDHQIVAMSLFTAYEQLARSAGHISGDSAKAVIARARTDLGKYPQVSWLLDQRDVLYRLYGAASPRLRGPQWFSAADVQSDTLQPAEGKVTLLMFAPTRSGMPVFRRLKAKYGDKLSIVFVAQTEGAFNGKVMAPDDELRARGQYIASTIEAPGPVLVSQTQPITVPDGRRANPPAVNQDAYGAGKGVLMVLIDRARIIRFRSPVGLYDPVLEREIDRVVSRD